MTEEDFRNSAANRQRLRELMNDPVFVAASGIIVDSLLVSDAKLKDDPIVSVRILSQRAGNEAAFQKLHILCQPIQTPEQPISSDFGARQEAANLEAHEKGLPPPFVTPT